MNINKLEAILTDFPFTSNWVKGTIGQYSFEAKLFDDPSTYGIGNGRVSKLSIYDDNVRLQKGDFFAAANNTCIQNGRTSPIKFAIKSFVISELRKSRGPYLAIIYKIQIELINQ